MKTNWWSTFGKARSFVAFLTFANAVVLPFPANASLRTCHGDLTGILDSYPKASVTLSVDATITNSDDVTNITIKVTQAGSIASTTLIGSGKVDRSGSVPRITVSNIPGYLVYIAITGPKTATLNLQPVGSGIKVTGATGKWTDPNDQPPTSLTPYVPVTVATSPPPPPPPTYDGTMQVTLRSMTNVRIFTWVASRQFGKDEYIEFQTYPRNDNTVVHYHLHDWMTVNLEYISPYGTISYSPAFNIRSSAAMAVTGY